MSSALSALYGSQPLVVWVEDEETRIVLNTAWAGDPVAIHVGGGNATIRAVVEDARRGGLRHVFGVVDRDFGRSNAAKWAVPDQDLFTYVLESPEIENLALDPQAMAECAFNTGRRSEADIGRRLAETVQGMTWWMACCAVLDQVRVQLITDFPAFPSAINTTTDLNSALAYILGNPWFLTHVDRLPGLANPTRLSAELTRQEQIFAEAASNDQWRSAFSGKQVFHRLAEYVHTKGRGPTKNRDLLQAVIQTQVDQGRIAQELVALRSSLQGRRRV